METFDGIRAGLEGAVDEVAGSSVVELMSVGVCGTDDASVASDDVSLIVDGLEESPFTDDVAVADDASMV